MYSLLKYAFLTYYVFLKVSSILYQEHPNFFLNPDLCGLSWIQELTISGGRGMWVVVINPEEILILFAQSLEMTKSSALPQICTKFTFNF